MFKLDIVLVYMG